MEESSNPLIQSELEAAEKDDFSLIDGSSLDDLLDSISATETSFVDNEVSIIEGVNKGEKPETAICKKNQEYNPRTSLPWDSAFNCAGILDAEELSRIIEGSNSGRHQMQHLSGIQDDISKSTDSSLSTLESDNLSLESLEADLFCDTRPSIQGSGESSKLRKLNSNRDPEGMDSRSLSAAGSGTKVSKGPHPGDSYSTIPKAALSAKSSLQSSTRTIGTSSSRSSFNSTTSSSVSSRISPLNRKQGKSDRSVSIPPSSFRSRLPSRVPLKGTIQPKTSCTSAYQSTPKDSPSSSPTSSISEWSSSSSVATVNQEHYVSKGCSNMLRTASLESLAWDSSFNCAGFLDAEELSRIIEGSNSGRHQMQHLSGIQEAISKSTDSSLSTLESDNLTLESLEADLFCDTRPSIQGSGESSKLRKLNSDRGPEEMDSGSLSGRKSTSLHGNMVKQKSVSRKPNASIQGDARLMNLGPVREHVGKPGGSKREPQISLSKLPVASDGKNLRAMTAAKLPNKRTPIATGRKNSSLNNVGNTMGSGTKVSKGPHPGDSYSTTPKAALSAKSSSQSSTSRIGTSSARSYFDSTTSSSVSSRISPLNGKQGKSDRTVSIPPSSFRSRLPSRVPLKGAIQPRTSCTSAYQSTPKNSPSSSPTNSISEWSSSSSVATVNQEHYVSKGGSNMLRNASLESLAWDSSFNCAGFLDAEELSRIIEGSNSGRHQMQHLSGIQEDMSKSTDSSLSTLESDNLTLESLEADLFCDIRPSIQESGESSMLRKLNSDRGPEEMDSGSLSGTKPTFLHGNMVKQKSVSRKPNASIQGDARLMKLDPVREPVGKPGSSKSEPQTSLSKLPAASDGKNLRAMTAAKLPNKRMPIATGRKNSSLNNVGNTMAAGSETKVSEGPHPGDSYSAIPKAAPSAKSSSHSSTSRIGTSSTRSSFDSTSSSSVSSRMLPLNGKQGKSDRTVSIPPSSFRSRLPSRVPLKGTIQPRTSCTSAYQSTPKDLLVHHLLVL